MGFECFKIMKVAKFFSFLSFVHFVASYTEREFYLNGLAQNLIDNIRGDLVVQEKQSLNNETKAFIDKRVDNFVNLMKRNKLQKSKRSISKDGPESFFADSKGFYHLRAVIPDGSVYVDFPKDINTFQQNGTWYVAALGAPSEKDPADEFIIFKYEVDQGIFKEIIRRNINKGIRLAHFNTENSTFIAISEDNEPVKDFTETSPVFEFTFEEKLNLIQSTVPEHAYDVVFWDYDNEIFLALTQFEEKSTNHLESKITIYKWLGKHFDIIEQLNTGNSKKVTPFKLRGRLYLAIATYEDIHGKTETYSDIYIYNVEFEKFRIVQRIKTKGCVDIKFFSFRKNLKHSEEFLVAANSFDTKWDDSKNYNTESIIYKYVDQGFLPFQSLKINGAENVLPIKGKNDEFVLFFSSKFDGLLAYKYDGWSFERINTEYSEANLQKGIISMHSSFFKNEPHLVVANSNTDGKSNNIFKLEFILTNEDDAFYDEMTEWCINATKTLEEIENQNKGTHEKIIRENDRSEDLINNYTSVKTNNTMRSKRSVQDLESLKSTLLTYDNLLHSIENQTANSFQSEGYHKINKDIEADSVFFNDDTAFRDLKAGELNNIKVSETLENVLNINEGFELSTLNLNSTEIQGLILPERVNNISSDNIVYTNSVDLMDVVVNGLVSVEGDVEALGKVNDAELDEFSILLKNKDQTFKTANISKLNVDLLQTETINYHDIKVSLNVNMSKKLKTLKVKNLTIGGFFNSLHVPTVEKYVLRKTGDQIIEGDYYVNKLEAENLDTKALNLKFLSNLVNIKNGDWLLNQNFRFINIITVNNLTLLERLNSLTVDKGGSLNVLLKNSSEVQYITKLKMFNDVELSRLAQLRGHAYGKDFQNVNPVKEFDKNIEKQGPLIINNNVFIEKIAKVDNIEAENASKSFKDLYKSGLKLTEKSISKKLNFSQQVTVPEIIVAKINDVEPSSWVVNGQKDTQVIKGHKVFRGNLMMNGRTNTLKVNDVNLTELERNIFRIDADQTIEGKHRFKKIIAESVTSYNTTLKSKKWSNVIMKQGNQVFSGTTIVNDVFAIKSSSNSTTVEGLTNGRDFTGIVKDTVFKDQNLLITGQKKFKTLIIDNLITPDNKNNTALKDMKNFEDVFTIEKNIIIKKPLVVHNIVFNGTLNGIRSEDFISPLKEGFTFEDDLKFNSIIVEGKTYIESNFINNVNITELVNGTVKIDEPFWFNSVTFVDVVSEKPIHLLGQVKNLDFENIIDPNSDEEQLFSEAKNFTRKVVVNGTVKFEGLVNGIKYEDLCNFASPSKEYHDKIIINGPVIFTESPNVEKLNNYDVNYMNEYIWFTDEETILVNGVFRHIVFRNNVSVSGLVGGIDLKNLNQTYFSKTRNQSLPSSMEFNNLVTLKSNISAPILNLGGKINDINLEQFLATTILDGVDQVFEDVVFLKECQINDLKGEYKVNNLNIENEVLLYEDESNIVTGEVFIEELTVDSLKFDKDVKIQDIDIMKFIQKTVLKNKPANMNGKKTFTNQTIFENQLSFKGTVNQKPFNKETIMLKNVPQNITGFKRFIKKDSNDTTRFEEIKLKGNINDVNIEDLIDWQAYKTSDIILRGPIEFNNSLTVNNLNIKKNCGGLNVSNLINNITSMNALKHHDVIYNELLDVARNFGKQLKSQPFYLHHYKLAAAFEDVQDILVFKCEENSDLILAVKNLTNKLPFYKWDNVGERYINEGYEISFEVYITSIFKVVINYEEFLYIEYPATRDLLYEDVSHSHYGLLMKIEDYNVAVIQSFTSNGTRNLDKFRHPEANHDCLIFAYETSNYVKIICFITPYYSYLLQDIFAPSTSKVKAIEIHSIPYLVLINPYVSPSVCIWIFNTTTKYFDFHQTIRDKSPMNVDTVCHKNKCFLATASGRLQNSMYAGSVTVKRFNSESRFFEHWQSIEVEAPLDVKLSILPSDELVLYILTSDPIRPLLVYSYQGISGFKKMVSAPGVDEAKYIRHFTNNANHHYVVVSNGYETNVIEAVFKGKKY